jgi:hypothetical protein
MDVAVNAASDQPLWSWQRSRLTRPGLTSKAVVNALSKAWEGVFDHGSARWMALPIGGSLAAPCRRSGYARRAQVDEVAQHLFGAAAAPALGGAILS